MTVLEEIIIKSKEVFSFWKNAEGWAPPSATAKLNAARLDWLEDLTESLYIWDEKSLSLSNGELLLAWTNLGALVEGWLQLFYCIYYENYINQPVVIKDSIIESNDLSFEKLKQFSREKLWPQGSNWDKWVDYIQCKRNAIHAFNTRDIGTPFDFLDSLEQYKKFIEIIDERIPYPNGDYH